MCGHYGWLATEGAIEHPNAGLNGGRIYIHTHDVEPGTVLVQGDAVVFYLYADQKGLGAEACCLQHPRVESTSTLNAGAAVFIPSMSPEEQALDQLHLSGSQGPATQWAYPPDAAPKQGLPFQKLDSFALNALAMQQQLMANWADLSDDSDDSGDDIVAEIMAGGKVYDADGDVESNGEQSGSDEGSRVAMRPGDLLSIPRRRAGRRTCTRQTRKLKSNSHSGSSSTGVPTSDSDGSGSTPPLPPPGLRHPNFRPPPGLSL